MTCRLSSLISQPLPAEEDGFASKYECSIARQKPCADQTVPRLPT